MTSIGDSAFYGCNGLTSITIPDGVTSIGSDAFRDCTGLTSITIPAGVTSIGSYAFYGCSGLASITIPDSVTSIGEDAFYGCTGLTSVTIGAGVTSIGSSAFWNCSGLASITIPDSVTSIGSFAFEACTGLTSVTIGEGVTSIGSYAFYNCTGLTEINWNAVSVADFDYNSNVFRNAGTAGDGIAVTFGEGVEKIPACLFYVSNSSDRPNIKSVTIGSNVTSIGGYAFYNCTGLTSVYYTGDIAGWCGISGLGAVMSSGRTLYIDGSKVEGAVTVPDGVTSIPSYAFAYQTGITSVTIPDSVTSIGNRAFYNCTGLTSITIPDSVTSIGSYAFAWCTGLTSITIPDSVTSIGLGAFRYCSGLTSITIPDSVTSIGDYAFYNCTGLTEISWNAVSVADFDYHSNVFRNAGTAGAGIAVTFGESVEKLPAYLFYVSDSSYSPNIKSVIIGSGVTSIGDRAFYNCTGLKSITIPDSVTSIGDRAFYNCTGLTSVTIGAGVTSIGSYAFYNCTGLTSVTFEETSGWFVNTSSSATSGTDISANLSDKSTAAEYLTDTYYDYYWKRNA